MPKAVAGGYRSKVRKPDDFDAFWDDVERQASAIPLEPEVVPDPLRTSEDVETFQVFYTSLEHIRIAAWYSAMQPRTRTVARSRPNRAGALSIVARSSTRL